MSLLNHAVVDGVLPRIDSAVAASVEPFTVPDIMRPDGGSKRYGIVHYGVFIPGLPEPFRYCNIMTLLGATGTVIMDNDYLLSDPPSDTATFLCSTAQGQNHHYQAYSIARECRREEGDVLVSFGDNLVITGEFPRYQVKAAYENFELALDIHCTDTVSWFVRNAIYDHFSLLASCSGTLTQNGQSLEIQDHLCTFEYARSASPYALTRRPIPDVWKLPADFFTYQIINLTDDTQLLLTKVCSLGRTVFQGMHVRTRDGEADIHVDDVSFEVLEHQQEDALAPDGKAMRLPVRFRWRVREKGAEVLEIECRIASRWRFGLGRGYTASYAFEGHYQGQAVTGDGYIEYIDCQAR
ncbi:MAG: DUF6670 family protein [Alcanivorax sp.]|uniref:DUF6670 family protein n=1 Tax=Alcanivorax sp. TaxID=1872427 RepID=UPI003DA6D860